MYNDNLYIVAKQSDIPNFLSEQKGKGRWKSKGYEDIVKFAVRAANRGLGNPKLWYAVFQIRVSGDDLESVLADITGKKYTVLTKEQSQKIGERYEDVDPAILQEIWSNNLNAILSTEDLFEVFEREAEV